MIQKLLRNWKTTSIGITTIAGAIIHLIFKIRTGTATEEVWTTTIGGLVIGSGFLVAKDFNSTGNGSTPPPTVPPTVTPVALFVLGLLTLTGCAHFSTTQTDERTNQLTGETTKVTTHASTTTFFDSSSSLSQFKATQTEKSQTATVGALTQEASGTNAANLINGIVGAAVNSAVKAVAPVPK